MGKFGHTNSDRRIVDGLQRIVSGELVLLALIQEIEASHAGVLFDEVGDEVARASSLRRMYVSSHHGGGEETKLRLTLPGDDGVALAAVADEKSRVGLPRSQVFESFDRAREALAEMHCLPAIWRGLNRVELASIQLRAEQDEHEVHYLVNDGYLE